MGYIFNPDERTSEVELHPEESCIHFSLGGLLGKYTIDVLEMEKRLSTISSLLSH